MSVNNVNPSTLFGGTWAQLKDRFLLGVGDTYKEVSKTGGEATHKLTAAESGVPVHSHGFTQPTVNGGAVTNGIASSGGHTHTITSKYVTTTVNGGSVAVPNNSGDKTTTRWNTIASDTGTHTHNLPSHTHSVSGGKVSDNTAAAASNAHNNMPPYLTVYIWKRTA